MKAFYFGTWERAGHHLRDVGGNMARDDELPWDSIDGTLIPNPRNQMDREGLAALHHKDGWTALAFADRSIDSRGGSNSVFFFDEVLTFDEAVAKAQELFPRVTGRFKFEIVNAAQPAAETKT